MPPIPNSAPTEQVTPSPASVRDAPGFLLLPNGAPNYIFTAADGEALPYFAFATGVDVPRAGTGLMY